MCGITGAYIFKSDQTQTLRCIDNAVAALALRGPDAHNTYSHNQIALGHARLSVIDTSSAANQPLHDSTGRYTIVFNGEIYNYKELRHSLKQKGYTFKTESDTEVLLYMFINEGTVCLDKLNGFFAFAIYDSVENTVFIARDRMGIKPLVYYIDEAKIIFASEIKSVLEYNIQKEIDQTALFTYLQLNYIPAPKTIFKNIFKLESGHSIIIKNNKTSVKQYYSIPSPTISYFSGNYNDAQSRFKELIGQSIQKRMVADVPLGAFLSGGIDSSIITGIASQYTDKLQTFSIGYKDEPYFDETRYAKLVAKKFKTEHTVFSLTNNDIYENLFNVLDYLDEPFADSSALAVNILSKQTRKHVTVALSGDGADELFSGYNKHSAHLRASNQNITNSLLKYTNFFWKHLKGSRNSKIGNTIRQINRFSCGVKLTAQERYWRWCSFVDEHSAGLLLQQWPSENEYLTLKNKYTSLIEDDNVNSVLYADTKLVLPNDMLHKVDMMSMANSLEVRTPFLDHSIVEFANSLPQNFKINPSIRKKIVQDSFRNILPAELYNRPKHGFEVPLLKWFRNELKPFIENEVLNKTLIQEQGIFNTTETENMKRKLFSNNPGEIHAQIWAMIVFQHWYKKYFL